MPIGNIVTTLLNVARAAFGGKQSTLSFWYWNSLFLFHLTGVSTLLKP
jgi:hypothetical protein